MCGGDLDRAAALLAFWPRFALMAPTTAATAPPPTLTVVAFATLALTLALSAALAFWSGTTVVALEAAAPAAVAATTTTAPMTVAPEVAFAAWFIVGTARFRLGCFIAPKQAFQPADEATGLLFRLRLLTAFFGLLGRTWLETALVATLLLALIAGIPWFALIARIARLPLITRITGFTLVSRITLIAWRPWFERPLFAAFAAFTIGAKTRALFARRRGLSGGTGCFPLHRGAFGLFRREDLDFGFLRLCGTGRNRCLRNR